MKVLETKKQLTHYCSMLRATARKAHREQGASAQYEDVMDRLEETLRHAGASYAHGVWLPDKVGGVSMNCGLLVDLVIEDKVAVLLDTDKRAMRNLEQEARLCLERREFDGVIVIMLYEELHCRRFTRRTCPGLSSERHRARQKSATVRRRDDSAINNNG